MSNPNVKIPSNEDDFEKFYFSMSPKERSEYRDRKRDEDVAKVRKQVFANLALKGIQINNLSDLPFIVMGMDQEKIGHLINEIAKCPDLRVMEVMIRALGVAKVPFDGRPLIAICQKNKDDAIEFAILNTISLAEVLFIDDWLEAAYKNDYLRKTLSSLGFKWKGKKRRGL